jgi:hypothetical protein
MGRFHTLVAVPRNQVGACVQSVEDHALDMSRANKVLSLQVHAVARLEVHGVNQKTNLMDNVRMKGSLWRTPKSGNWNRNLTIG